MYVPHITIYHMKTSFLRHGGTGEKAEPWWTSIIVFGRSVIQTTKLKRSWVYTAAQGPTVSSLFMSVFTHNKHVFIWYPLVLKLFLALCLGFSNHWKHLFSQSGNFYCSDKSQCMDHVLFLWLMYLFSVCHKEKHRISLLTSKFQVGSSGTLRFPSLQSFQCSWR